MHWAPGKGGVPKTQDNQERRVRLHIVPHLGERPLRNITAADLRAYIAKLEATVSSVDYRRGILSELSSMYAARSRRSREGCTPPCRREPRPVPSTCPLGGRGVEAPRRSVPASGGGASVGEAGGAAEEVLPAVHHTTWQRRRGEHVEPYTWKPALAEAGIIPPRAEGAKPWQWAAAPKDGFHVLRHTYASIMLEAGESVVALARWLGHSSPAITLGYYAHFMPAAGSKGRTAIDGLLGRQGHLHAGQNSPDSPQDRWRAIPTVAPP
ncbi:tyrosine-type recombinase/integrase [Streptomyces misionensis]|uniref:tyrosine-type recombinase/integrase n=1 Tax=Streptomyces misionensis TaxID=67331 RepID=UPI00367683B9